MGAAGVAADRAHAAVERRLAGARRHGAVQAIDDGWEAELMISRSALDGTRWLTLRMLLAHEVRTEWESQGTSARARALQVLANYLRLTEWDEDDIGVLDLK